MSMKISFESNITGFERVSRVLQEQQKLINDNAAAFQNLNNAKAGLGKTELQSYESIKTTAASIKDLVGAFDTLTKSQSGLQGFMGTFGQFSKQLSEFTRESSAAVFKGMNNQVAELKKSITDISGLIEASKTRATAYRAAGKTDAAIDEEQGAAQLGARGIAQQDMLRRLQMQVLTRTPIGTLAGFGPQGLFGGLPGAGVMAGGPSMMGIAQGVGGAISGTMMAGYVGGRIVNSVLGAQYAPEAAAAAAFRQEMGIAQGATQGAGGRAFMLRSGIGSEAGFERGGNGIMESLRFGTHMAVRPDQWLAFATNPDAVAEQYRRGRREELSAFDQPTNEAISRGMALVTGMAGGSGYGNLERTLGMDATRTGVRRNFLAGGGISRMGLTAEQTGAFLPTISAYGLSRQLTDDPTLSRRRINAAEHDVNSARFDVALAQRGGSEEALRKATESLEKAVREVAEARLSAPGAMMRLGRYYGMADQDINALQRQEFYRPGQTAPAIGQAMAAAQGLTPEARTAFGGLIAQMTNRNMVGPTDIGLGMAPTMDIMGHLAAPAPGGAHLDPMMQVQAAADATRAAQGAVSRPDSLQGMAFRQSLIRLGVRDPGTMAVVQEMVSRGQLDQAQKVVSKVTGKSIGEVSDAINKPQSQVMKLMHNIMFRHEGAAIRDVTGISGEALMMGGGLTPTAAGLDVGHMAVFGRGPTTGPGGIPLAGAGVAPVAGVTTAEMAQTAQAQQQAQVVKNTEDIIESTGQKVGKAIADAVAAGFRTIATNIEAAVKHAGPRGVPMPGGPATITPRPASAITGGQRR